MSHVIFISKGDITMHFSHFTRYMNQNRRIIPNAVWQTIRREGIARLTEQMNSSRADCELDFSDLIERAETAII